MADSTTPPPVAYSTFLQNKCSLVAIVSKISSQEGGVVLKAGECSKCRTNPYVQSDILVDLNH